jgi:DoxX-like family
MPSDTKVEPVSKGQLWTGRIMSALPSLVIAFAAIMKLTKAPAVVEGVAKSGYPVSLIVPIGIIELSCLIVYLIPQTSVLGAILVSSFLGGATATCVRVGDPAWPMPVLTGVLIWGGLFFREPRLRALIPLRSSRESKP